MYNLLLEVYESNILFYTMMIYLFKMCALVEDLDS